MTDPSIRTRRDGSIDTGFYLARGRHLRSVAAHRLVGRTPADSDAPGMETGQGGARRR